MKLDFQFDFQTALLFVRKKSNEIKGAICFDPFFASVFIN